MNHEPLFEMRLDGVQVGADALLGTPEQGSEILAFTLNRTTVATCALVSGVADKALHLTAHYTTERKQFDRAIGTFQAVGQRMADCFIDNQAIELTMLQAATHLDEGRDDPLEIATAKFWAADGGNRIAHAALHIHGGVSIDVDFPIHRYFLWLKRYEFSLGSATPELLRIGKVLADTLVAPVTRTRSSPTEFSARGSRLTKMSRKSLKVPSGRGRHTSGYQDSHNSGRSGSAGVQQGEISRRLEALGFVHHRRRRGGRRARAHGSRRRWRRDRYDGARSCDRSAAASAGRAADPDPGNPGVADPNPQGRSRDASPGAGRGHTGN